MIKKEDLKELTSIDLLLFQSEVTSRIPVDTELQELIYEEMKKRRKEEMK